MIPDLWPDFLGLLAHQLRAESAALHLELDVGRGLSWQHGRLRLPELAQMRQMRFDRVYAQIDMPGHDGRLPMRVLKCSVGAIGFAVLAVQRGGQDFRAVDGVKLSGLGPYLGQALANWFALDHERARAALDRQVSGRLGGGWIMFTPAGNVIDMADNTREWLDNSPTVQQRPNGWLEFREGGVAQSFRRAVAAAQAGNGLIRPVEISRDPAIEIALMPKEVAGERVLLGLIRHGISARSLSVEQVATAFDLSRSEARLAILLCDGASLQDAALDLGWTLETTRSCSKQVYARMGVKGQSAVLRRMLTGAVWLT
ncbi:helix-turn-helix transcriptional regulator [Paracoccus aestuariivivens]|uniref:HTH luxR-type domain-containing protein n=1 Tax=Paracoccus aestuariivivens TaxID=1820333 RepID=A0A6L6J9P2_9RHOB|nr:hypothetical protein [Paracoccus aestuariivivens]MTH76854.1 hypothetical protein [Paracoccus aestuariivivens]